MRKLRLLCVTVGLLAMIALLAVGGLALVSQARSDRATASPLPIEEYTIVSQEVDAPEHFDYLLRIPAGVLDLRRPWRDAPRGQTAPAATGWWQTQRRSLLTRLGRSLGNGCHPGRTGRCRWIVGLHLLDDDPLVFLRWAGQVRVWYRGGLLPVTYDDVIHGRCCEPAAFNITGNDSMVWFHALRDGTWLYVEMRIYGEGA